MADVLSQSQIDALLKSMSADAPAQETKTESVQPLSPEEKNYIKYAMSLTLAKSRNRKHL